MDKRKLPIPILPFSKPLDPSQFNLARDEAYAIYKSNGRKIGVAEVSELARRHAKGATLRTAIASSIHDYLVSFGIAPGKGPVNSQAAIKWAGLVHDVYRGELTMRELADRHGVHEKHIPRIMRDAGNKWNRRRRRWEPLDAGRHYRAAKAKLKAHKAWAKENKERCHWVALPEGRVDLAAICEVQIGVCMQSGKINLGHMGRRADAAIDAVRIGPVVRGNVLMQQANYLALKPSALAHLVSQEVKLEVRNGYPALAFPCGQLVFLHKRNYLISHGLISLPRNTHLHHVDGNPLNAAPRNIVAMLSQEHNALHSFKG